MKLSKKTFLLILVAFVLIAIFIPTKVQAATITLNFDTAGGTEIPSVVLDNESLDQAGKTPADPVKEGSTFFGWYTSNSFESWDKCYGFDHQIFDEDTTLYALFIPNDKLVTSVNVTVASPIIGSEVNVEYVTDPEWGAVYEEISVRPEVTILNANANYKLSEARWIVTGEDYYQPFEGTIQADTYYLAEVTVYMPETSEYRFAPTLTITANGAEPIEVGSVGDTYASFVVKVASTSEKQVEEVKPIEVPEVVENVETAAVTKVVPAENNAVDKAAAEAVNQLIADIQEGKEVEGINKEVKEKVTAALDAGKTVSVEVTALEVKSEEVKEDVSKIEEKLGNNGTVAALYDMTVVLKVDGESIGNVTNTGKELTLKLPVPKNLPAVPAGYTRVFTIYKVHNGVATELDTNQENDELLAKSGEFSTYAVTYKDVKNTSNPSTGDNIAIIILIFVISVIGLAVTVKKMQ